MDGRPTFFMYTVFAIDRWINRVDASNTCCQSSPSNTESPFQKTVSVAMADRLRRGSPRGVHALPTPPRRASALQKRASACPTHSPAPFASLSPSPRAAPSYSRPPLPTERPHRRARSSLQKCAGHLAPSLAVISSTSSTSPSIQLCLGKGEIAVSFHRRHG